MEQLQHLERMKLLRKYSLIKAIQIKVIVAGQTSPRAKVEMIGKEFQLSGKFKFGQV